MNPNDIAEMFVNALGKIEFYWNFFTVTILVLIGWFVSMKTRPAFPIRILILVGYFIFVAMNIFGLWGAYSFAEALKSDLILQLQTSKDLLPHTLKALEGMRSYETMRGVSIGIHSVIGIVMVYVILFFRPARKVIGNGE